VVQEVAHDLAGTGVVVQINTDENHQLAQRFGIRSIPAFVILRRGEVIDSFNGALSRNALLDRWRKHVA
jgi:thioredoxin-like negative regulator of GroEL